MTLQGELKCSWFLMPNLHTRRYCSKCCRAESKQSRSELWNYKRCCHVLSWSRSGYVECKELQPDTWPNIYQVNFWKGYQPLKLGSHERLIQRKTHRTREMLQLARCGYWGLMGGRCKSYNRVSCTRWVIAAKKGKQFSCSAEDL